MIRNVFTPKGLNLKAQGRASAPWDNVLTHDGHTPKGLPQQSSPGWGGQFDSTLSGLEEPSRSITQGALARPWALGFNPFGVNRSGMTLIEIAVVMGIMAFLAGLMIAFWPGIQNRRLAAQGAVDLQGYLSVAAANARRDQVVWGVRLLAGAKTSTQVTNCQFLRKPDDFYLPGSYIVPLPLSGTYVTFVPPSGSSVPLDFTNGETDPLLWAVYGSDDIPGQPRKGDYLIVNGGGQAYQITNVVTYTDRTTNVVSSTTLALLPTVTATSAPVAPAAKQLTLSNILGNLSIGARLDLDFGSSNQETVQVTGIHGNIVAVTPVMNNHPANSFPVQSHGITSFGPGSTWRIIRSPRVVGEEVLNLPDNIVVDLSLNTNTTLAGSTSKINPLPPLVNGNLDILFSPSGAVVTPVASSDPFLALWVRNLNADNVFDMGTTILGVFVNTGLTAAHRPNQKLDTWPNGSKTLDPYKFVRDGSTE